MQSFLRRSSFASLVAASLASACFVGCGSDPASGAGSATEDAGDGRYHPAGNGKAMTEQDACASLSNARQAKAKDLGCSATVRPCPSFLRAQFPGNDCVEYDEGTVTGCVGYYGGKATCEDLATAVTDCAVAPMSGTHSAGCQ